MDHEPRKIRKRNALLRQVEKPGRYLGNEVNAVVKSAANVSLRLALAFPDVYEVAFSHVGLKILYEILNDRPDTWCERVYSPWPDFEEVLRRENEPLFALESGDPLDRFDVLGFTLQYDLSYSNVLAILDLAGLPLRASERNENHPLIVGGGPNAANPEPLAEFFDLFVLGEGEEAVLTLADAVIAQKTRGESRAQLLENLAKIEGFYVPSRFTPRYENGRFAGITPLDPERPTVRRAAVADLDHTPFPVRPPAPNITPVHDRYAVEIQRGCARGCRFCQASQLYRPVRQRTPATVFDLARQGLENTGETTLSLLSLSAGDYGCLNPLLESLDGLVRPRRVDLQLPSLRVEALEESLLHLLGSERKGGFTLAPEAGSERLRRVINKGNTDDDLLASVDRAFRLGWQRLKLYFMIGLPTETDDDLHAIVDLAERARFAARRYKKGAQVTVSVSTFVPKPHTPFQWAEAIDRDEIRRRQSLLFGELKRRKIQFKFHDSHSSLLEMAFSRGDRRLGDVIESAYRAGARFDAWSDRHDPALWEKAFEDCGMTLRQWLEAIDPAASLPWDHLNFGPKKSFLQEEWKLAHAEEHRPDCSYGTCYHCGVCSTSKAKRQVYLPEMKRGDTPEHVRLAEATCQAPIPPAKPGERRKVRFKMAKRDRAVFMGHLDTMKAVIRAFRRAGISLVMSEGFHPSPRVAFGPALPVGVSSNGEFFDAETMDALPTAAILERLRHALPNGFDLLDAIDVPRHAPSLSESIETMTFSFQLPENVEENAISDALASYRSAKEVIVERIAKGKPRPYNLKERLRNIETDGRNVTAEIINDTRGSVKPLEILQTVFDFSPEFCRDTEINKVDTRFRSSVAPKENAPSNKNGASRKQRRRSK